MNTAPDYFISYPGLPLPQEGRNQLPGSKAPTGNGGPYIKTLMLLEGSTLPSSQKGLPRPVQGTNTPST